VRLRLSQKSCAVALALALSGCSTLASRGAVVGCQAADTGTTLHALSLGAKERNPVVRSLLDNFGTEGFIAAKIGVTLLILHSYPALSMDLLATIDGITCAAAVNNALVARKIPEKKDP
jgi:hypothetical protein